jgi:GTA TIM-barrel-like domain
MAMLLIGSLNPVAGGGLFSGILGSLFSVSTAVSIGLGLVQRALTPDQVVKQQGARLTESQFTTSVEGSPILRITGRMRLGGQVMWATTFLETIVTSTESQGGKGGPKLVTQTTEYVYSTSFAVGLCEGGIGTTLGRVWADGKLLDMTNITFRFYDGTQTLADPKIEAVEGAGMVPAHTGVAYIVFEDMVLTDFGNRIPQITCEVNRSISAGDVAAMEQSVEAVNIIPGSGEFILGTTAYSNDDGEGNTSTENSHSSAGITDFVASMDRLGEYLPNVGSASLVVSWFGSTLDAATCEVRPKVDSATKTVTPTAWRVSNVTRATAPVVSTVSGMTAYGGTPSDVTVREAVIEMKARGLRVMFYPFLLMDMVDYPWRGRITGSATTFLGTITPAHYGTWTSGALPYSGPVEWSHRRMILHYAALMRDLMTAGDAFLIGSEMVGLTESDAAWGTGLASLVAAVKTILPVGVKVSYASDWSEYDHVNLLPLWSSADFIGIDYYMPLTDWRVTEDEVYTVDHFKAGITSGEYWDYYYVDEAARLANVRTPILTAPFRQKDIISWRTAATLTAKPIWFTEFGCAAVDKGANQPNVFVDAKSSESATPWFSDGTRNDTVQRLYIEALLDYWRDSGLIDPADMFVWTWDARPYPSYGAMRRTGRPATGSRVASGRPTCPTR